MFASSAAFALFHAVRFARDVRQHLQVGGCWRAGGRIASAPLLRFRRAAARWGLGGSSAPLSRAEL